MHFAPLGKVCIILIAFTGGVMKRAVQHKRPASQLRDQQPAPRTLPATYNSLLASVLVQHGL